MSAMTLAPPPSGPGPSPSTNSLSVPTRPKFNSHITSDRLREGAGLHLPSFALRTSNIQKGRTSVFREMGLEHDMAFGDDTYLAVRDAVAKKPSSDEHDAPAATTVTCSAVDSQKQQNTRPWYVKLAPRPALAKRRSSQGRMSIPTVNVVGTETQ